MRLIDADKIRYSDMSDGHIPGGLWYTFKDNVDKIPTVEAIPIEWIEEYMVKWPSLLNAELPGVIEDWRKENETN